MVKENDDGDKPSVVSEAEPPHDFANVPPPRDLYRTSDIRFVLVELGKVSEKIDTLNGKVDSFGILQRKIETTIDRVRTGLIVGGAILSVVGCLFWWAIGDRITIAVKTALLNPSVAEDQPPLTHPRSNHPTQNIVKPQ